MILVFTYINITGNKDVIVSTILSVLVIGAFHWLLSVVYELESKSIYTFYRRWRNHGVAGIAPVDWVYYIGIGIAIGMWMYAGYEPCLL